MDNIADVTFTGGVNNDYLGVSVSSAGDVNGDGYDDAIIGATFASGGGTKRGEAYIYYGGSSMDNIADVTFTGGADSDELGCSVSSAGDVNGDGYNDVIIGAWKVDAGDTDTGEAYIYYGGIPMDSTADITFQGGANSDYFGFSVSSAGDVNGDGYKDIIVGAWCADAGGTDRGEAYLYQSSVDTAESPTAINNDTWHHLAGTFDGSDVTIFLDGVLKNSIPRTDNIVSTTADLIIGISRDFATREFNGGIDEVRISNVARSGDWIKTCCNNQSSPSDFYSMGSEEAPPNAPTLTAPGNNAWINNNTPLFDWDFNDPDAGDIQGSFQALIDDDLNFGSVNYDSGEQTSSNTYWQFPNGTSYIVISDGSWYWKCRTKDNNGAWGPYSDFWTVKVDTVDPTAVTDLHSTSHTIGVWSADNTVDVSWTAASDSGSGLDGYSILWDTSATSLPDTTKDIEESVTTDISPALADGNSHYFHIRSVDNIGNWSDTAVHVGPFYTDTSNGVTPLDHFTFTNISNQIAGTAFGITIYAKDSGGNTVTTYTGISSLSDTTGTINPVSTGAFTNGVWTGNVTITRAETNIAITASYSSRTGTSNSFNVDPSGLSYIIVSPETSTINAGSTQTYTVEAFDVYNNSFADVTGSSSFFIDSGARGSWSNNVYISEKRGTWTVTATYSTKIDTATLTVNPGEARSLEKVSGDSQSGEVNTALTDPFLVMVTDDYGNPVTGKAVSWSIIETPSGATGQRLSDTSTITDSNGEARSGLTLGDKAGTYKVQAVSDPLTGSPIIFTATVSSAPTPIPTLTQMGMIIFSILLFAAALWRGALCVCPKKSTFIFRI